MPWQPAGDAGWALRNLQPEAASGAYHRRHGRRQGPTAALRAIKRLTNRSGARRTGGKRLAYDDLAAKDKERYQRELATYSGISGTTPAKRSRSASGGRAAQMRRTDEDAIDDAGGRGSINSGGGERGNR